MPRSVDPRYVRRWAELADQEKTVAEMRRDHRKRTGKVVDPRTIERALARTRAEIAERTATAAELQRGIRLHGEQLLASIDPLMKTVRSTITGQLNPAPVYAIDKTSLTLGSSIAEKRGDTWRVQLAGEKTIELRLLREHLPSDKVWKLLAKFSESMADWITARIGFAFEINRKLTPVARSLDRSMTQKGQPFERAGLSLIDVAAANARINGNAAIDDLLDSLAVDSTSGDLHLGPTKLCSVRKADVEDVRSAISSGVGLIMKSDVGLSILTAKTAFDRAGSDLVDELATLKFTTYLPGTCASCKRFRLQ